MHDIDRTQVQEAGGLQDEFDPEFEQELDTILQEAGDYEQGFDAQEIDLASELMVATTEQELDQVIGEIARRRRRRRGGGNSNIFGALGGMLKGVAKQALPIVGGALGTAALPGIGTAGGAALGSALANIFELPEGELLEEGDFEFEVARRFVRLADDAMAEAADMPANAEPRAAAREALKRSAERHAPGLARVLNRTGAAGSRPTGGTAPAAGRLPSRAALGQSGRWVRRGNAIILLGVR